MDNKNAIKKLGGDLMMTPPGYTKIPEGNKSLPKTQKRTDSVFPKVAVVMAVIYIAKTFFNYEMDNHYAELIVAVLYALYNVIAAYNNPKDKRNF